MLKFESSFRGISVILFSELYDDSWINPKFMENNEEGLLHRVETNLILVEREEEETRKTLENPAVKVKYKLGKELSPGDYIEIHGTYSSRTDWFSVNIMDSSGNILIHVNPRPSTKQTGGPTSKHLM